MFFDRKKANKLLTNLNIADLAVSFTFNTGTIVNNKIGRFTPQQTIICDSHFVALQGLISVPCTCEKYWHGTKYTTITLEGCF
jgi:hypothetical protein